MDSSAERFFPPSVAASCVHPPSELILRSNDPKCVTFANVMLLVETVVPMVENVMLRVENVMLMVENVMLLEENVMLMVENVMLVVEIFMPMVENVLLEVENV